MSEYDREASIMRRPLSTRGSYAIENKDRVGDSKLTRSAEIT